MMSVNEILCALILCLFLTRDYKLQITKCAEEGSNKGSSLELSGL